MLRAVVPPEVKIVSLRYELRCRYFGFTLHAAQSTRCNSIRGGGRPLRLSIPSLVMVNEGSSHGRFNTLAYLPPALQVTAIYSRITVLSQFSSFVCRFVGSIPFIVMSFCLTPIEHIEHVFQATHDLSAITPKSPIESHLLSHAQAPVIFSLL